jgi:microsomal epoxide hydrolase
MLTSTYATLPNKPSIKVEPYTVSIPDQEIEDLKVILKHTRIPKETFENKCTHTEDYGVTRGWFIQARDAWLEFDW